MLTQLYERFRRRFGGGADPFAYVGAPVKPNPPLQRSAIRLPLP